MAYESFHDFIRALEKAGELTRVALPVATELEITELADRQMKSPGGGKALLIEKPTINDVVSPFPVAINAMGSWKRMALSLGANSVEEVADELAAKFFTSRGLRRLAQKERGTQQFRKNMFHDGARGGDRAIDVIRLVV